MSEMTAIADFRAADSKTAGKLRELGRQIQREYPDARVMIEEFPSGSVTLDVKIYGAFFVLEYQDEYGFGLTRVPSGDASWDVGHDETHSRLTAARLKLLSMVSVTVKHHQNEESKKRASAALGARLSRPTGLLGTGRKAA